MSRPKGHYLKSLAEIAAHLGLQDPELDVKIIGLTHDSRAVRPGDLYVALPGFRTHGARFADSALAHGAKAVLTDTAGVKFLDKLQIPVLCLDDVRGKLGNLSAWFYNFPSSRFNLVGVTGTNGKTTTAHLIDSVWRSVHRNTGLIGTIETRIRENSTPSVRTTPEATDLQAIFAKMFEEECSDVVMEVSSHALRLGRVSGTHFAVAVFTNLSQDHLDFHADMDDYFKAKAMLFSPNFSDLAVINIDDKYGLELARLCKIPTQTFSATQVDSDWNISQISRSEDGSEFTVQSREHGLLSVKIPLIGDHNVSNALAALIVLVHSGLPLQTAIMGLGTVSGVPGRLERIDRGQPFSAIVDYAHTPDAVERILEGLRAHSAGRIIGVLGCGGDRDPSKRPLMGAALARGSDIAFLTSDNPRSEDPYQIIAQMASGAHGVRGADIRVEVDRAIAISLAVDLAKAGDIVLIAGKGHEQGQESLGVIKPFDDREVLAHALDRRISRGEFL